MSHSTYNKPDDACDPPLLQYASPPAPPRASITRVIAGICCSLAVVIALNLWATILPKAFDGLFGVHVFMLTRPPMKTYNVVVPPWLLVPALSAVTMAFPAWRRDRSSRLLRLEWEVAALAGALMILPIVIW
jgi:hypothetical protein